MYYVVKSKKKLKARVQVAISYQDKQYRSTYLTVEFV